MASSIFVRPRGPGHLTGRSGRAISSGVERHVDIVEVGGSKPPSPTIAGRQPEVLLLNQLFPGLCPTRGRFKIRLPSLRPVRCAGRAFITPGKCFVVDRKRRAREAACCSGMFFVDGGLVYRSP